MSSLNGSWIEVFRAGDYGERGEWTAQDLDRLAAAYNPRLQPAPVVVGHPKDDAPAYGWIARLRRAGQSLWAQLEKVDAGFEKLLREGRFQQRSVALYRQFAPTGAPYLRHVGFLGAQPPAVKGLAPVRFAADSLVEFSETFSAASVGQTFLPVLSGAEGSATLETQAGMPAPLPPHPISEETVTPNKLETFFDHLRSFFNGEEGSNTPATMHSKDSLAEGLACAERSRSTPAVSSLPNLSFEERLGQLEQRLETLASVQPGGPRHRELRHPATPPGQHAAIENFVETLRRRGSFPPAFDRLGVAEFMHQLAEWEAPAFACHSESAAADEEFHPSQNSSRDLPGPGGQTLLVWFQEFLSQLPRVIEFNELTPGQGVGGQSATLPARVIRFTEPRRGMEVDPESVELAERAEAFAAEQGVTYAEALTRLRHNQRHTQSTA